MNFGGRGGGGGGGGPSLLDAARDDGLLGQAPPGRGAAPPQCPRCELVKSQATKTVINYQRAHRKKLEALRTELKSSRGRCDELQQQARRLNSAARLHLPSLIVGCAAGACLRAGLAWIQARRQRRQADDVPPPGLDAHQGGKEAAGAALA